jgi:hypothetical protein
VGLHRDLPQLEPSRTGGTTDESFGLVCWIRSLVKPRPPAYSKGRSTTGHFCVLCPLCRLVFSRSSMSWQLQFLYEPVAFHDKALTTLEHTPRRPIIALGKQTRFLP